jgi:dTDP-4-amino-4,6-dideoxygalactose transaminase
VTEVRFLDMHRHVAGIRRDLDAAIASVLDRGSFVLGTSVESFEHELAAFCGVGHAVGVASGTDALELALRAVGVGSGDDVITAANTCIPTVSAIQATGATPVLADVDARTRTLSAEAAAAAVNDRTKALVPVHLYGQCADMDALLEVARDRDLAVVEDAAQALGATYHGARAGSLGDAAACSFYPTKNLGALGDAGAVVTHRSDVADVVRSLRSYGERKRYESLEYGRNSRLDELQAELLRVQLPHLDGWNIRRRELAERYLEQLQGTALDLPGTGKGRDHVYHLFVVASPDRESLRRRLAEAGVETLVHYPRAVHQHPGYSALGTDRSLATSERLAAEVLSLPLYPELTIAELDTVAAAVRAAA